MINNKFLYNQIKEKVYQWIVTMNPKREMIKNYYGVFGRKPDLNNPKDLIEKIYWLQLNTDTSLWTKCADKYAMREYIKDCGFVDYLPKNYGCWKDANEIDFDSLPNEFVIKTNNGCGTVLIVKDKSVLDIDAAKNKLNEWLKQSYGWRGAQLHYTRIMPCIIAEELLQQDEFQKMISPKSQIDYKVWCFHGVPENILLVFNRDNTGYFLDLYDTKWNRINNNLKENGHFRVRHEDVPKPSCLSEMLTIAQKLALPFPEVRVDFYVVENKPIIGELTFTTGYGYFTDEYYRYLGSKIELSITKSIC
jgi:hypothetical protein